MFKACYILIHLKAEQSVHWFPHDIELALFTNF